MKHPLLPACSSGTCTSVLAALAILTALALAPAAVQAQVSFDTFDDGDVSDVFPFSGSGAGIGVGTTDGVDGAADAALSVGINPADAGSFAGFVITGGEGTTDVSAASYLSFYVRPTTVQAGNLPLTLEINLHEDVNGDGTYDGNTEDEYQAVYRLTLEEGYTFVQIPVASFGDDNSSFPGADDGFDFANLLEIVVAIGGPSGPEFAFALDEVLFLEEPVALDGTGVAFDTFDDGDVSDVFPFSGSGAGIGVGTTDGADGAADAALSVGINPADAGSFAGFVITGGEGTTDVSAATYFRFLFRPTTVQEGNLPLTLEINLHEDVNGDGTYDGNTEDEYQALYRVGTGSDYTEVVIPVASFGDDNASFPGADDGFDLANLLEIVVAIGGPAGPEFAFALDEVGFVSATDNPVSIEENTPGVPDSYTLSNAYPNPFNPQARFELTVHRSQDVRVEVYDVLGRQVDLLFAGRLAGQTRHTFTINGQAWPSGIYLYRVTGETFVETRRVVLAK